MLKSMYNNKVIISSVLGNLNGILWHPKDYKESVETFLNLQVETWRQPTKIITDLKRMKISGFSY